MNLSNALTLLRILLIPLILIFLGLNTKFSILFAVVLFLVAVITDFFDGYLARKNMIVTDLGKVFDPLSDKILVISILIYFATIDILWYPLIILILTREIAVTSLRVVLAQEGKDVSARKSGNAKVVIQYVSIFAVMILLMFESETTLSIAMISNILFSFVTLMTLYSGFEYFSKSGKIFRNV